MGIAVHAVLAVLTVRAVLTIHVLITRGEESAIEQTSRVSGLLGWEILPESLPDRGGSRSPRHLQSTMGWLAEDVIKSVPVPRCAQFLVIRAFVALPEATDE